MINRLLVKQRLTMINDYCKELEHLKEYVRQINNYLDQID